MREICPFVPFVPFVAIQKMSETIVMRLNATNPLTQIGHLSILLGDTVGCESG